MTDTGSDDLVWRALASAHRRRILDALRERRRTTGELVQVLPELSRFAVMQHLGVLVEAGLVLVHREGRIRWNSLNVVPLQRIHERWISPYQSMWAGAMLRIRQRSEAASRKETAREESE
jgi:DNA-binding transcriptional ArsR family regulator